ncbi:protein of unknown function (DUF397) [Goodfellowiella coeruleoviolacea]|uniref:DUF397 domain-containing protein n=2 Tax=Goodfellowiella coeruleoviolacea TaxID=334858 RepID=A0AAE3GKD7_9PSEU|nr:protein of unknown function (DUF397) [Goodfellowiella coeruleoviolacea]
MLSAQETTEVATSTGDLAWPAWRKASRSGSESNCVELAHTGGMSAVRDSKNPAGPVLMFGPAELAAFLTAAKVGRFDG